jgi:hypothetical protein
VFFVFHFPFFNQARAQWECTLYGGVAMPVLSSDNAPGLRVSLATGLRGGYSLGHNWLLTGEVWQVRQLREDNPDITALPLDTAFHVKRYQLIPLMLGAGYRFPLNDWAEGTVYGALGACFRYIHCQQQTALGVIDDRGESGWGFAGKLSAELTLWKRLGMQVWFMALGSPGDDSWKEEGKKVTYNRSHWQREGYRQCFWGVSLGYGF